MPPSYYTVETQNKFAFLDSDSGGEDQVRPAPPTGPKEGMRSPLAVESERPRNSAPRGGARGQPRGGDRGSPRGGMRSAPPRGPPRLGSRMDEKPVDDSPIHGDGNDERRLRRPRGGGPARGRGREFDRHSGTGRGREMKREGGGAHNWGRAGDDEQQRVEEVVVEEEKTVTLDSNESPDLPPVEEKPVEPESITLDQYTRLQNEQRAALPQLPRPSGPKKELLEELTREGFEEYVSSKQATVATVRDDSDDEERTRKGKKTMSFYELGQQNGGRGFNQRRTAGATRGGGRRGGPQDRRPDPREQSRPSPDHSRTAAANLNLTDKSAFPSLAPRA